MIDEDCSAFAFAPDGRVAYAVRRILRTKRYDLQRDDVWVAAPDGKRKRIVDGEKLVKSPTPFSYAIQALAWSPDSRLLTVEMATSQVVDEKGSTRDMDIVDLMDDQGKEINIADLKNSAIPNAFQATWLADGQTVVFLTEAVKPKLLFQINMVRPAGSRGGPILSGHVFNAVVWDAAHNSAIAVEKDASLSGPPRLVKLDLIRQTRTELAELPAYSGELAVSPSGAKVAYYRDGGTLEIRAVADPSRAIQVPVTYGSIAWSPDEQRILLKRGPAKKSGDLEWISIPSGALTPVLHGLLFRDFEVSPDGHWLGVTEPGKHILQVYPLQ